MMYRLMMLFLAVAAADVETALEADDACAAGEDCSLELNQLRGMKVNYLEALMDDEDEEQEIEVEDDIEGSGACTNHADLHTWKSGGRKSFDGSLNQCGRSCAAGFPCTKDCMSKKGYSAGCASCMAHLVECSRDKCINQCISNDKGASCGGCVKKACRPSMKQCSGFNAGGH
ncbi:unnamed protein product [Effrenium voratum]|nr:unnamed protein product [Effrenium voratum]